MATIKSIESYFFECPLEREFHPAWIPGHAQTANRCFILKLITEEGIEGIGAASCFSEDQARVLKVIVQDTIGQFLMGGDPEAVEVYAKLVTRVGLMLGGRPWLVETALWDLAGKLAGQPLYRMWGGTVEELPVYASTGEVNSVQHSPVQAIAARAAGFKAIKLRAHSDDYRDDVVAVEAVRAAVGRSMKILVDANQGWSLSPFGPHWEYDTALAYAQAIAQYDVYWLEEPLDRFDFNGLAKLRAHSEVRIAGGEMNQGLHEFEVLLEKDALDIYQPDATLAGGVLMARKVAELARERGHIFSPHTWTTGIGFAINMHIAASVSNCPILEFPYEPASWTPQVRDAMLRQPFLPENGFIRLPQGPGLGVTLCPEAMARYAKRL